MAVFEDTLKQIETDERLAALTEQGRREARLYGAGHSSNLRKQPDTEPNVAVTKARTFEAAMMVKKSHPDWRVGVLNFASATNPGGGVKNGSSAQEECLCRSSSLYAALTIPYLLKNYYKWNKKNTGDMGTDAVIYSPGVTVFKTDDAIPQYMDQWFAVDVLTCAAPYYDPDKRKPVSMEKLEEVFRNRIRNILEVAAARNVDILVLGAFGCGAFNNPPDLVADVFRYLLVDRGYGRFFKKTVFAVKKNNEKNTNLSAFQNAFQP